jgi:antitoxin (DNA-binding transcriptional repressor) of toxin-antitoxin stability system
MKRGRRTIGSRDLKTRLGAHLKRVREGATLVITDRGHPIAELRPLDAGKGHLQRRLAELEALGILSRETRSRAPLRPFQPIVGRGRPASDAVCEDREDRF